MMFKRPKQLHRARQAKTAPVPATAPEGYHWTEWAPVGQVDSERFRKTVCCRAPTRGAYETPKTGITLMVCICFLCKQKVAEYNGTSIRWLEKDVEVAVAKE